MRVLGAGCGTRAFRVAVGDPIEDEDARHWTVRVALRVRSRPCRVTDTLTITTSHPKRPTVLVPMRAEVRGDLQVTPASVFLGFVQRGETKAQEITLRSRGRARFAVKSAELRGPSVAALRARRASAIEWKVALSVSGAKPGTIDTVLVLTTDVRGEETVEVPVYAHVLGSG